MRFDPNAVEHQHVKIAKPLDRFIRDEIQIGGVSEIVEPISDDRQLAVDHLKRRDLEVLAEAERSVRIDRVRNQLRKTTSEMRRLEDILEDAAKIDPSDII